LKKECISTPDKTNEDQKIIQTENNYLPSNFFQKTLPADNNYWPSNVFMNNFVRASGHQNPDLNFLGNDNLILLNNFLETPKKCFLPNIKNSPLEKKNKRKKRKNEGEKEVDFAKISEKLKNAAKDLFSTGDSEVFKRKNEVIFFFSILIQ
jgi:hypothetical protein